MRTVVAEIISTQPLGRIGYGTFSPRQLWWRRIANWYWNKIKQLFTIIHKIPVGKILLWIFGIIVIVVLFIVVSAIFSDDRKK